MKEAVLGRAQVDRLARPRHLARLLVHLEVLELQPPGVRFAEARAPQDRADAGDQLLEAERLRDVVVDDDRSPSTPCSSAVTPFKDDDGQHKGHDYPCVLEVGWQVDAPPPEKQVAGNADHHAQERSFD